MRTTAALSSRGVITAALARAPDLEERAPPVERHALLVHRIPHHAVRIRGRLQQARTLAVSVTLPPSQRNVKTVREVTRQDVRQEERGGVLLLQ